MLRPHEQEWADKLYKLSVFKIGTKVWVLPKASQRTTGFPDDVFTGTIVNIVDSNRQQYQVQYKVQGKDRDSWTTSGWYLLNQLAINEREWVLRVGGENGNWQSSKLSDREAG